MIIMTSVLFKTQTEDKGQFFKHLLFASVNSVFLSCANQHVQIMSINTVHRITAGLKHANPVCWHGCRSHKQ